MIATPSIWGAIRDYFDNRIVDVTGAGAPTNGSAGTGVGITGPTSLYRDTTNAVTYENAGSLAIPNWVGHGVQYAKAIYDFSLDGGLVSTITPVLNDTIPKNAIILGGILDIVTTFVGATATIAIGTSAGSSTSSIKAATAVATYTAGLLTIVPVFTAATAFKMTASGLITVTIATAALTVAKMGIHVAFLIGD